MHEVRFILIGLAIVVSFAGPVSGQMIRAEASSRKCVIDEVLTVQVEVVNPKQATTPMPEASDDFEIRLSPGEAQPAVFTRQSWNNGRFSSIVKHTYTFDLRPLRTGRLTVPSFVLKGAGGAIRTKPITILVGKSGGLPNLFCKVVSQSEEIYVGEPVDLALEIWVRRYRQRGLGSLNESVTWRLGVSSASRYGVFEEATANGPMVRGDRYTSEQGVTDDYFVYIWKTTVYPKQAGPLDLGDIVIAWNYPTEVGRVILGYQHLRNPRRLRASPSMPRLEVKPIPLDGRPADYNGAIGRFSIYATAKPTEVPLGDPITLTLVINGEASLDRVGAPKLKQVQALTRDFEISGESLAGEVQFERKIFSLTIRALREDVQAIPPIPMSFFDPRVGRYETTWSKPIPVKILPINRLALSTGGESTVAAPAVLTPLVETMDGLQANFTDIDAILADQSGGFGRGAGVLMATLPIVYLATWFVTRRSERFREDVALRRRRYAYRNAKKSLRGSGREASAVSGIVLTYVADRCNVPAAGLTCADARALLSERGIPEETRKALDSFLSSLEQARYAGGAAVVADEPATEARRLIDELERCDLT
ncbi:MAG: BatD family protein [Phycisphaerae bacterium]